MASKTTKSKSVRKRTASSKKPASGAKAKSKVKAKARAKPKARVSKGTRTRKVTSARTKVSVTEKGGALTMRNGSLVVSLSKDSHPEIFEVDALAKEVNQLVKQWRRKSRLRNEREFLVETEKSLQIILSNLLEDALRKYLK